MLILLTLLALNLPAAADAGVSSTAPVTPALGTRAGSSAGAPAKPVDVSQLPFTPDSISQVVRAHQPEIQACYEKLLAKREEAPQGRLMTHFVITAAGTVTDARVEKGGTTLKDKELNGCVLGVLSQLHFPKPADAKNHPVEYPFNLQAVE